MLEYSHQLILATVLLFAHEITGAEDLTELLQPIVECFKDVIKNGMDFEDQHIMPLENIHFDEFDAPVTMPMFQGDYNFSNILLKGTSDFDVTLSIDFVHDSVYSKFTLNNIDFSSQYSFDSKVVGIADFVGKGDLKFHMKFDINLSAAGILTGPLKIKLIPAIKPDFLITGLSVGEKMSRIISKQMNSIIITAINSIKFQEGFSLVFGTFAEFLIKQDIELSRENVIGTILRYCNTELSEFLQRFQRNLNSPAVKIDL